MSNIIDDVAAFTKAVGCTTDEYNVRQIGLYIGLELEEMAEQLAEIINDKYLISSLVEASNQFKSGFWDDEISEADRTKLLHESADLAWVTIGAMLSMGADVKGTMGELARANMSKLHKCPDCNFDIKNPDTYFYCETCKGTGFVCKKDENGKVIKPDSFKKADMSEFVCQK